MRSFSMRGMIEYWEKAVSPSMTSVTTMPTTMLGRKTRVRHANGEEHDDQASGEESLMMQNVEAFGDDGAGGVSVRDSAEGS